MSLNPHDRYTMGTFGQVPAGTIDQAALDQGLRSYMLRVFNYMGSGLLLTGIVALWLANSEFMSLFFQQVRTPRGVAAVPTILGWVVMLAPLGMLLIAAFMANSMSRTAAQVFYWVFVTLMGLSLSAIFLRYTGVSIARTFFVTAATFGAMSLWGYTTKRDLSGWGSFLLMGLIGIIIAGLVNLFIQSSAIAFAVSAIGVVIFTLLMAFDAQRIKNDYIEVAQYESADAAEKRAVFDAIAVYLNFVNLFQLLLSFLGQRNE